jgi:hypothetical protein
MVLVRATTITDWQALPSNPSLGEVGMQRPA